MLTAKDGAAGDRQERLYWADKTSGLTGSVRQAPMSSQRRRDAGIGVGLILLFLLSTTAACAERDAAGSTPSTGLHTALVGELASIAPPLVSRQTWNANEALPGMKGHTPGSIIIHHTSVLQNKQLSISSKMRNLQAFSQRPDWVASRRKPAWGDVPYHFYIDLLGSIAEGRDVHLVGDTNTKYDPTGHIQVVLEGDFEKEQPTPEQLASLPRLLVWLSLSWNIPIERVSVHKDHAQTDCPGRNLIAVLPDLLRSTSEQREHAISSVCGQRAAVTFSRLYCSR